MKTSGTPSIAPPPDARTRRGTAAAVTHLYFVEGFWDDLPAPLTNFLASAGMSNTTIPFVLSQLYIPNMLRAGLAPLVETRGSKRFWAIACQLTLALLLGAAAVFVPAPSLVTTLLLMFMVISLVSTVYNATADGIFAISLRRANLNPGNYVGIQGASYCAGKIVVGSAIVYLAGYFATSTHVPIQIAWSASFGAAAVFMAVLALLAFRVLPKGIGAPCADRTAGQPEASFARAWTTFFAKPKIVRMLLVVFFYRFGETFLDSYYRLFLQDPASKGGLGFSLQQIGTLTAFFPVGIALGRAAAGALSTKVNLQRSLLPLALVVNIPHLVYFGMSMAHPTSIVLVGVLGTLEKFTYGFGTTGLLLYILKEVVPGKYPLSHFAFATGVIDLARWLTGSASALIFGLLGAHYSEYFLFVLLASLVPIGFVTLAPFSQPAESEPAPSPS